MDRRDTVAFVLFTLPIYVILFAVLVYPVYFCAKMSLCEWDMGAATGKLIGFAHYRHLLTNSNFWLAFLNVAYIGGLSIPIELILGFSIALLINRAFEARGGIFNSLLAIPMMTAPVVSGLFWRWLLDPGIGIVNYFLSLVNIQSPPWFGTAFWARNMVVIANVWQFTPFILLVMYAGLQSLPKQCMEASIVDGATAFQRLRYITIPLLKRLFLFVLVIRSAEIIKSFDAIYVLTGGGPASTTETPSIFTYKLAFNYLRMGRGAASGIIFLGFSLLLIILFIRILYLKEKEEW